MPQPGVSAQARRMARSCCLNSSGRLRETRMPRQPRKGFGSGVRSCSHGSLSPPESRVRKMTPWGNSLPPVFCSSVSVLLHPACRMGCQQKEFRAEQAYPFRSHLLDAGIFMGELHVDGQADVASVPGDGGQAAQRFQRLVGLFLFHLEAVVVFLRFFRGFQDEHALVAVQDGGEWLSTLRRAWSSPTTAGMPMERARMAVWETEEPISVAKP